MKITKLKAENVHGYLPIDIEFLPQLTFLTGLNGSGKTSALRLLMALLTPNLEEFALISFATVSVTVEDGTRTVIIRAEMITGELILSIDQEQMVVSSSELQLLTDLRRRDEPRAPVLDKVSSNDVFQKIKALSTPMFLGIDRRHFGPSVFQGDAAYDVRRRQMMMHRMFPDEGLRGTIAMSLAEVNYLVVTRMQQVRAAQEKLDDDLRKKFFTRAFEYKPADLTKLKGPSRQELESVKKHLLTIQTASEALQFPLPDIQASLADFFERMTRIVTSLEKGATNLVKQTSTAKTTPKSPAYVKPNAKRWEQSAKESSPSNVDIRQATVEWLINSPQADRIMEHLQMLEGYVKDRAALRETIDRFLLLVNGFLQQTKKSVHLAAGGDLVVQLDGADTPRSIAALSSGERQLLVMLAHLSLNPNLAGSGVFIVDEPELSLHIDWQEKFVDAIREANPSVQMILATHSPAIILDRVDACVSLS